MLCLQRKLGNNEINYFRLSPCGHNANELSAVGAIEEWKSKLNDGLTLGVFSKCHSLPVSNEESPLHFSFKDHIITISNTKCYKNVPESRKFGPLLSRKMWKLGQIISEEKGTVFVDMSEVPAEYTKMCTRSLFFGLIESVKNIKFINPEEWEWGISSLDLSCDIGIAQKEAEVLRLSKQMSDISRTTVSKTGQEWTDKLGIKLVDSTPEDGSEFGVNKPQWIAHKMKEIIDTCYKEWKCEGELVKEINILTTETELESTPNIREVGRGSKDYAPPCLLTVSLKKTDTSTYDTAVVGKGITFDTGGKNLKPEFAMADMHQDKTGACAAFAIVLWCMLHMKEYKRNTLFFMPFAENTIGPHAYAPGDRIILPNGVRIKVGNTDAEGRLVMADCLALIAQIPTITQVFTIATLTGGAAAFAPFVPVMYNDVAEDTAHTLYDFSKISGDWVQLLQTDELFHKNVNEGENEELNNNPSVPMQTQAAFGFLEKVYVKSRKKMKQLYEKEGKLYKDTAEYFHIDCAGDTFPDTRLVTTLGEFILHTTPPPVKIEQAKGNVGEIRQSPHKLWKFSRNERMRAMAGSAAFFI